MVDRTDKNQEVVLFEDALYRLLMKRACDERRCSKSKAVGG